MTTHADSHNIMQDQMLLHHQRQQPIVSMANTSVSMYDQKAQQQPQTQFSQPGTQAQRQINCDTARKFAELAKQQAELQRLRKGYSREVDQSDCRHPMGGASQQMERASQQMLLGRTG